MSNNTLLEVLECNNNQLASIDISNNSFDISIAVKVIRLYIDLSNNMSLESLQVLL